MPDMILVRENWHRSIFALNSYASRHRILYGVLQRAIITGHVSRNRSLPPLGARASRPPKSRPRWPRSQEKGGVNGYCLSTYFLLPYISILVMAQ